jgi:UV damage endonuclease UvdE
MTTSDTLRRIGFCCKWLTDPAEVAGKRVAATDHNTKTTTVAWLNRQTRDVAVEKLWSLVKFNIESTRRLVERVGALDARCHMVRIGSDILPMYTHADWSWFYREPDVRTYAETHLAEVGRLARALDVRLSFHPGQYCVLASDNDNIVERSIEEFEYHVDMARWMGYGKTFQDFKINVHIAGRAGTDGLRAAYQRLSPEARNTLTIENEEISYGLDDCLRISDLVPIVLDIHHHWIREGEYIQPDDHRVRRVIDSWRGQRPVCHYSVSREDVLVEHSVDIMPDHQQLLTEGYKKQKLRAHSNFYWNKPVNNWAASFNEQFDIMCESKAKNLASFEFYNNHLK